jgi:predicted metal-dependent peptidase
VAAGHPWRRGHRNHDRWNDACDYAINPILLDANLVMPVGALIYAGYRGMAAEMIFEKLPQKPTSEPLSGRSVKGDRAGEKEGIETRPSPQPGESKNSSRYQDSEPTGTDPRTHESETMGSDRTQGEGQTKQHDAQPIPGEVRDAPPERSEELEADWKMAVEAAGRTVGNLPGNLHALIERAKKSTVDWREVLRAFVQQSTTSPDYAFARPNRRYVGLGLYVPELVGQGIRTGVIVVDTSGSVSNQCLEQFHGEIQSILDETKPEKAVVIYADAEVQATQELVPEDGFSFEPSGRGGTSFVPVFDWVEAEGLDPDFLVYLTDLEGPMPAVAPQYPVLWVTPPTHVEPRWGEKLELNG